jgi:hypothetical protein
MSSAPLLPELVTTTDEFDRITQTCLPDFLDRATGHIRRFLRETGQWSDDGGHEKLALRWGYELVEQFLIYGRAAVPCRPTLFLDSLIARHLSQPDPFCRHKDLATPLGGFLHGLANRATVSRDALMALFFHWYGWNQSHIIRVLGLGLPESQRVYKNFDRWRQSGWERAMLESGLTPEELQSLDSRRRRQGAQLNAESVPLLRLIQSHYRKSEPAHYPCLDLTQWISLYEEDCGYDYRAWHLPLCHECVSVVYALRQPETLPSGALMLDVQIHPPAGGRVLTLGPTPRNEPRGDSYEHRSPRERLSSTTH